MKGDEEGQPEEEVAPEDMEKFKEICEQAAAPSLDYQRQSSELQKEIVGMVEVYNKNQSPEQAVPVDKIMAITSEYQNGMREVQQEYSQLSEQLRKEEDERNGMME